MFNKEVPMRLMVEQVLFVGGLMWTTFLIRKR